MAKGYILLSRKILKSEVFASINMLKIWLWCLCKANYETSFIPLKIGKGNATIKIERGEFIFGRLSAEKELFINGSTIYRIMKKLEEMGNILIKSNSHYSVVTICNYNNYQDINYYKEQPTNSQRTTNEQPTNNQRTHVIH